MKGRESALIRELLALYAKYGEDIFEAAVREIRTGDATRLIADAAEDLQRVTQRSGTRRLAQNKAPTPKKTKKDLTAERILDIKRAGRQIDVLIGEFAQKILDREVLTTPAALREYMAFIGVPMSGRHPDRYDALIEITSYLRNLPETQVIQSIDAVSKSDDPVSSLQRWTDIIVKPDRN